jgi:hypothetical protein
LASGTVTHDALPEAFGDDEIGNGFYRTEWATQAIFIITTSDETDCVGKWFTEGYLNASHPDICNPYGPFKVAM